MIYKGLTFVKGRCKKLKLSRASRDYRACNVRKIGNNLGEVNHLNSTADNIKFSICTIIYSRKYK